MYQYLSQRKPKKIILGIKFGLLSPELIRKMSVTEIVTSETYDEDGMPIRAGPMDRRLGTIEPGVRCETCGNYVGQCPGHFGHIELERPVIHVEFVKYIHTLLRATCRHCGRILLPEEEIEKYLKKIRIYERRWKPLKQHLIKKIIKKTIKNNQCPYCGEKQYKIKLEKPMSFYEERERGVLTRLNPKEIRSRLERIPDKDLILLGFDPEYARPEWMILRVLPVPPIAVRPSITLETGMRSEDDLTHKLVDIIRINQRLRENIEAGAPEMIIDDLWDLLQYHVATYFDNELPGIPPAKHRSGRALRTLAQRLKGKEGRFRGSLAGKRVDFSARTVISPDPNISINEVGVPIDIAKTLLIQERVTEWNIDRLRQLIISGPDNYPGANYIVRPDGGRIDLRYVKDREALAEAITPGYIVERHLQDGDVVLFNRQPSLHRMSIMAHKVKVLPYKTFRIHLCVCPPYNADFDGDEMNLHVPQTEEARAEAESLMLVQEQILSPRYGGPIMGATQDYITAAYLFTRKDTLFDKKDVCRLLMTAGYKGKIPEPVFEKPIKVWTGKQLFSLFLPEDFSYTLRARVSSGIREEECNEEECPFDGYVIIKNGILLTGVIDKNAIGAQKSESLLHRLIKDYGNTFIKNFIDNVFRMFIEFLDQRGFSIGLRDLDLPEEAWNSINEVFENAENSVRKVIAAALRKELEPLPGKTLEETLEARIMEILTEARDKAGQIANRYLGLNNEIVVMAQTGARANIINITQMTTCLGQVAVRGERIKRGYRGRPLPHFKQGDIGARARGFVYGNFKNGLSPIEFFYHAMGGREGLVDTAVRTAQSGYMYRRLANALQDLHVKYDGTVRTSTDMIIQLRYGEDGVDPSKSDHGKAVNVKRLLERELGV